MGSGYDVQQRRLPIVFPVITLPWYGPCICLYCWRWGWCIAPSWGRSWWRGTCPALPKQPAGMDETVKVKTQSYNCDHRETDATHIQDGYTNIKILVSQYMRSASNANGSVVECIVLTFWVSEQMQFATRPCFQAQSEECNNWWQLISTCLAILKEMLVLARFCKTWEAAVSCKQRMQTQHTRKAKTAWQPANKSHYTEWKQSEQA